MMRNLLIEIAVATALMAERVANVLEYAAMLTATEPKMKPWMKACAERIKEAVKAERERRKRKEY